MKTNYTAVLSFLLLLGLTYFSFYTHQPQTISDSQTPLTEFSTARAMLFVDSLSREAHAVGTPAHQRAQDYLVKTLKEMGLEVEVQNDFAYKPGWGALSRAENIIARIPGSEGDQSLLLMSHYDSAPHTASHGASDAGSGVAAILESLRAYMEQDQRAKNDLIILFTDAEELGLNGATVFVKKHPWAKDVNLALNFEARGSGGPSNMIVETNGGNANLIKAFARANPSHPYANSLMFSVYKLLPNDTDSTVLREYGDIDGFFFAFIGDHFDYHTANDIASRLDPQSLEHQGRYLTALLDYFKDADLNLKAHQDFVYFNFPLLKLVYYPFSWIIPMLILAWILFFMVLIYGLRKKELHIKAVFQGFLPLLIALMLAFGISWGWKLILAIDPAQNDILHGFPYNAYELITGFVALSLGVTLLVYHYFHKPYHIASLSFAALFVWLLIATGVSLFLKGASFFVIPVYFGLLTVYLILRSGKPNFLVLTLLCAPALFILAHYIKEIPVGLGLKMLGAATILSVLIFGLLLPVMAYYKRKNRIAVLFILVSIGAFISAFAKSDFTESRRFPSSLNYVYDSTRDSSFYVTYNTHLDPWLESVFGENPPPADSILNPSGSGKYKSYYTYAVPAQVRFVAPSEIYISKDTVIQGERNLNFIIYPQRNVGDMMLLSPKDTPFLKLNFNGQEVEPREGESRPLANRKTDYLVNYRLSNREPLEVNLRIAEGQALHFTLLDYSYDLFENPDFDLPSRPLNSMPMPFVKTDALITIKEFEF